MLQNYSWSSHENKKQLNKGALYETKKAIRSLTHSLTY